MKKIIALAALAFAMASTADAEISQRAQQQAAQRAYQASAQQHNEVAHEAARQWRNFSNVMRAATIGAFTGGAVGAAGNAANAAANNRK